MPNNPGDHRILDTDLYSYLRDLARRLRFAELALEGFARRQGGPAGDSDLEALVSLGASLDTTADVVEAGAEALCQKCKLTEVTGSLRLTPARLPQETRRTAARRRYRTPRPSPKASDNGRLAWTSLKWPEGRPPVVA